MRWLLRTRWKHGPYSSNEVTFNYAHVELCLLWEEEIKREHFLK